MYPKVKVPVIKIRNKFSFPFLSIAVFSKFATRSTICYITGGNLIAFGSVFPNKIKALQELSNNSFI